jgi:hypothetical protein
MVYPGHATTLTTCQGSEVKEKRLAALAARLQDTRNGHKIVGGIVSEICYFECLSKRTESFNVEICIQKLRNTKQGCQQLY